MKKTRQAALKAAGQVEARAFEGFISLPLLILIFVLVAAASFILLRESVQGLYDPALFEGPKGFFLLFASPLLLIALALSLFYAFYSELLKTGKAHPSAARNFRIVCAFAILSSALFCVFANTFIARLFFASREEGIAEAVEGAAEIAREHERARLLQAEAVSEQFLTGLRIYSLETAPQSWLPSIRGYDPYALAVQVYKASGEGAAPIALKEEGDSSAFLGAEEVLRMDEGQDVYGEAQGAERALIRVKKTVRYAGLTYEALYTSLFPQEAYKAALVAERAKGGLSMLRKAEPLAPFFGFWLYFSFILPPLLVLLLCALYLFVRLSDPLSALEDACDSLAQGKAGAVIIPQRYAGLESTVHFVNAKSDAINSRLERAATNGAGNGD